MGFNVTLTHENRSSRQQNQGENEARDEEATGRGQQQLKLN